MKKNISIIITLLILIIIFNTNIFNKTSDNIKYVTPTNDTTDTKDHVEEIIPIIDINSYKEEYKNDDIISYLSIPNTKIKTPVVKTSDNDYYLNHDISKNRNSAGAVFMDYRVNPNDKKVLIYGHNSTEVYTLFRELENYYQEDYYKTHNIIELTSSNSYAKYQIFSVYVEPTDWTYMNIKFNDDTWLEHINKLKNNSWYKSDIELTKDDEILIIQTCSYHQDYKDYKNKYLLLIAKKIENKTF